MLSSFFPEKSKMTMMSAGCRRKITFYDEIIAVRKSTMMERFSPVDKVVELKSSHHITVRWPPKTSHWKVTKEDYESHIVYPASLLFQFFIVNPKARADEKWFIQIFMLFRHTLPSNWRRWLPVSWFILFQWFFYHHATGKNFFLMWIKKTERKNDREKKNLTAVKLHCEEKGEFCEVAVVQHL